MRPFFSYFGGKWQLAPHYPLPEHGVIVEPFAGSAGFSTRYFDREIVLVEKAPHVARLWKWLTRVSVDEVLSLPLDPRRLDGVSEEAKILIGFWCARCRTRPAASVSTWMTDGRWSTSFWGESIRKRIADQVSKIRHWRVVEGDYTDAPDVKATWFVDPPYVGSRHYLARVDDYASLGAWCLGRSGQVIVCEQRGADWLPFEVFRTAKSVKRGWYDEVVFARSS